MTIVFTIFILSTFISLPKTISQTQPCNAISLSYVYNSGFQIPPASATPPDQAYNFQSTLTLTNAGTGRLNSWRVFVGFQHREILVSASNAVVVGDGVSFPVNVSGGGGVVLAGFPVSDLKSGIETAGDFNQMQARVQFVGTQFGVAPPGVPLPASLYLVNDGYLCSNPSSPANNETHVCCERDPNALPITTVEAEPFETRQEGDITIMYDILSSQETEYMAQVTISNHNTLGRLDYWQLSWDWMRDEFIHSMKGAYPSIIDTNPCIFGRQGEFYKDLDFSKALSCERRPTIIDLPLDKTNDTQLGLIPFCCRNGTLLPRSMDAIKSVSVFNMQVFKMPPDLNRTQLTPPQNWKINAELVIGCEDEFIHSMKGAYPSIIDTNPCIFGRQGEFYKDLDFSKVLSCERRPTIIDLPLDKTNDTQLGLIPFCCRNGTLLPRSMDAIKSVSVFNMQVFKMPPDLNRTQLTPPQNWKINDALLVPFDNRTTKIADFAKDNDRVLPDILPCSDNCGVSINWHLLSDFKDGWTARMTIFNWGETNFADWFAAVELDKSMAGFKDVFSFNGTRLMGSNNTIFLQGLPGLNYIVAEADGKNPKKDPRVPGMQQSVISFTKKNIPGLDVARGDGFPNKVYFNGLECSVPPVLPITGHGTRMVIAFSSVSATLIMLLFLHNLL
ncbi:COBRA-like protein 7 [Tanacetum coccineum]